MSTVHHASVVFDGKPDKKSDLTLSPGLNLRSGIKDFTEACGSPTSLEEDMLRVSSSIFACDLAFKRGERENVTRSINLRIPVTNLHAFERLHEQLEEIIYILSHDNWTIQFTQSSGIPEGALDWPQEIGQTLLFSGGLDSLAAAVDLLDKFGPDFVQLVSHITANRVVKSSQESLADYLNNTYASEVKRIAVRTGGVKHRDLDFPSDREREETQRTRSFMFLAIAALMARRRGHNDVVMLAENGQMAIHLPLSAARIGAFSTHTAHPQFVHKAGEYFSGLLNYPIQIVNPYVYSTKAEVVRTLVTNHSTAIEKSVSCWRGSRLKAVNHCGECVPCLIRRIALEKNGLCIKEYARDLLSEEISALNAQDEGKRNLVEIAEFSLAFKTLSAAALEIYYPDLFNEFIDRQRAIEMYRRSSDEALSVLSAYTGVRPLLPEDKPKVRKASRSRTIRLK